MHPFLKSLRRYALFFSLLALIIFAIAGAAYFTNRLTVNSNRVLVLDTPVAVTPAPLSTPIQQFAQIDPAILPYLQYGQPQYGIVPMDVLSANVPPLGAYLPRTGNTQFGLPAPTLFPTAVPEVIVLTAVFVPPPTLPYPTSPPLPTLVLTPTLDLVATVIAFDQSLPSAQFYTSCAPSGLPIDGMLTQRFHGFHSGIDVSVPSGTPVYSTQSAVVTWADWNTFGYGNLVILQSDRYITYYAHLTSFNVTIGQYVQKGAIIGFSGNTGNSSGPHVHYETRIDDIPVDPLAFEARALGPC
jgi:murein DD-endopeptidase MepM/ murein hydrolase activator NlpD